MDNAAVAHAFEEVANLLEIEGGDGFRLNSYRRVARTLHDLTEDINAVAACGELGKLPGVGKNSAQHITELLTTGHLSVRDELAERVPLTLLELLDIPGVGPKKITVLWRERGITTLDELAAAIDAGQLDGLKGFGEKTVAHIARGIAFLRSGAGRIRLGDAWPIAQALRETVAGFAGVTRAECAGSLRRGRETVGDLDLLCIADNGAEIVAQFTKLPDVAEVLAAGETKGSVRYTYRPDETIQVDLRVVPAASFGAAWMYFTGSKEHNVRLRERAIKRGWSLNEYGLTEGERVVAAATEEEVYAALELPWLPPELREDRGEIQAGAVPAGLLELGDIRGDLHMHTTASDGRNSIAEMAAAARERGYEYICITEHSGSSAIANGLSTERLRAHVAEIRRAAAEIEGITVLAGTEADILADGTLDYPDEVLAQLDFVMASIHAGMGQDIEKNTRRTIAAMENPYVNCIGHPTGRLINEREAMALDIVAVCAAAARTGTALEINASRYRLDLKDQHARQAHEAGALLCINTDSHGTAQLAQVQFGVQTARRGWTPAKSVLNTRSLADLRAFVQRKRPQ